MVKNVLITGGLGHIGSKLIKELPLKCNLTVVDNLLTQRFCSLFDVGRPIKFIDKCISDITVGDLTDIDVVIHLAAITDAANSFNNIKQTENINLTLTSAFIDVCEKSNCKFIFPSSTSVYGTAADIVYEDNDDFLNPQSPYATTKIGIEKKLKLYKSGYLILRFGTIFGLSIGMRFHTAINRFCYDASLGKPLKVWKENYDQYRPYLGLNDAIDSILFFLNNSHWNGVYNILSGNYRLSNIIDSIRSLMDVDVSMVNTPLLNQFSYEVSDDKIKSLGWQPKDDLILEITKTLNQFKDLQK